MEDIHYALFDVEELGAENIPVCGYGEGEDECAAEHAMNRGGFVLKFNGAASLHAQEVTVDYVSCQMRCRPGDIVDQARLHPHAAGLAVKLLEWIVNSHGLGDAYGERQKRDVAERSHNAVVAMIHEGSAA